MFRFLPMRLFSLLVAALFLPAFVPAQPQPKDKKTPPPQIVVAVPLAVEQDKTTKLTLRGLNLDGVTEVRPHEPRTKAKLLGAVKKIPVPNNMNAARIGDAEIEIEITLPKEVAGSLIPISLIGPGGESKPHSLIVIDGTPQVFEKEPNDGFRNAQPVGRSTMIEGSIRQSQDVDVFKFEGKAGEKIHCELQAARFGSPVDGVLTLYDANEQILATANETSQSPDATIKHTLPKDGTYFLTLIDAHDQGGSIFVYRLSVR